MVKIKQRFRYKFNEENFMVLQILLLKINIIVSKEIEMESVGGIQNIIVISTVEKDALKNETTSQENTVRKKTITTIATETKVSLTLRSG